jgi:hypothetical protein
VSWCKEELKRWLRTKWEVMACILREEHHVKSFPIEWQVMACIPRGEYHLESSPLAARIVCSCVCSNWRSGKIPVVASWYWNETSVQIDSHLLVLRWQRNLRFSKHFKPTSSICWWLWIFDQPLIDMSQNSKCLVIFPCDSLSMVFPGAAESVKGS